MLLISFNFAFTLSQTMDLLKANLNVLTNISTPDVAQYHCQLPLLLGHWSYQVRNTHAILYKYRDVS